MRRIALFSLLVVMVSFAGIASARLFLSGAPAGSLSGPVAEWVLNSGSITGTTVADASGNGNTATVVNGPLGADPLGSRFNGTTQYLSNTTVHTGGWTQLTVFAWVNPSSFNSAIYHQILGNAIVTSTQGGFQLFFYPSGNAIQLTIGTGTGAIGQVGYNQTFTIGGWSFCAVTWDGATMRFFLNGVQVASAPYTGVLGNGSNNIEVARDPANSSDFFAGSIFRAGIYNRALTSTEIAARYNAVTPPQSIASIGLSNTQFTPGTANAVVGAVSVTMNPASPAFSGTLSLAGTNSGGFHLSSTTLPSNLLASSSGTAGANYSDVSIVATQSAASFSPGSYSPVLTPTTTVPASANAGCLAANGGGSTNGSCFNTQVINLDPTGTTSSFVGTKGNFNATSSISSWLYDANGGCTPASPMWYVEHGPSFSGAGGSGNPACGDFTVAADPSDGINSLKIAYTQNNITNGIHEIGISTPGGSDLGAVIPISQYMRYKWRVDTTSLANLQNAYSQTQGLSGGSPYFILNSRNQYPLLSHTFVSGSDTGSIEIDAPENHFPPQDCDIVGVVGSSPGNFYNARATSNSFYGPGYNNGLYNCSPAGFGYPYFPVSGYNPSTGYVTIEHRITGDTSGNFELCTWVNGVFLGSACVAYGPGNPSTFVPVMRASRGGAQLSGVASFCVNSNCNTSNGGVPPITLLGPITVWFRDFEVWSCSTWNSGWSLSGGNINIVPAGNANDINPCWRADNK